MLKKTATVTILLLVCGIFAVAADQKTVESDRNFVTEAAHGGMLEVHLGSIAQHRAKSADVKAFGARMVTDHGKANQELTALAKKKNISIPPMPAEHASQMNKFSKLSESDFDKEYMQTMVRDHVKDVAAFRNASQAAADPDLKAWAASKLPTLEQHLAQAKSVASRVGVDISQIPK